ncbi:UNVERIFIED_CONTAM: hypothetical protein Sindi_1653200 [Sesamum indicum]
MPSPPVVDPVIAGSPAVGLISSHASARPWDAPPPPAPPLPPASRRHYISLWDARSDQDFDSAIHATIRKHYPYPWGSISQITQDH